MNHSQHFPNQRGVFFPITIASTSFASVGGVLGDSHVDWELSQPTAEGKDVKYFMERQLFSQMFWINSWYQKPKYKKSFSCWKKNTTPSLPNNMVSNLQLLFGVPSCHHHL